MTCKTVTRITIAETEEKRSRFIAHLVPYEDFDGTLERLRQEHRKASHHVTAIRVIDSDDRISEAARDDGEPAGTSGMPVLKTLIGAKLINVGMIVTRYFGGTKLGTGGLARAYAAASNEAILAAPLVEWQRMVQRVFDVPFAKTSEAEQKIASAGLIVLSRNYHESGVRICVEGPESVLQVFEID